MQKGAIYGSGYAQQVPQHLLCSVQVLVATKLHRTPSLACPDLFTFEDHFNFERLIGKSPHSRVTCDSGVCPDLEGNAALNVGHDISLCGCRSSGRVTSGLVICLPSRSLQESSAPKLTGKGSNCIIIATSLFTLLYAQIHLYT